MGDIKIAGHMAKKSTIRDLNKNIISMYDEEHGGYIIRNRQIVNQARYDELVRIEKDKREALLAATQAVSRPDTPDRTVTPAQAREATTKMAELETKVNGLDTKMDAILAALSKPKRVTKKKKDEA